jgi:putative endonuclease
MTAGERRARLRRGRFAEMLAAAALMAKGYRILGRNVKTRAGEIDIVAVRGKRLVFVEVKRRLTADAAEAAIGGRQAARIHAAADYWIAHRPRYHGHEQASIRSCWCLPLAPPRPQRPLGQRPAH